MPERLADHAAPAARSARLSRCGGHRLLLERRWAPGPVVGFVMLNPSVADAAQDDPTLRRCIAFARRWGFGGLLVGNLWTLRATDPREVARTEERARNAPGADAALAELVARSAMVVEAWGSHRCGAQRAGAIEPILRRAEVRAVLQRTRGGAPSHPLYLPGSTRPVDAYSGRALRLPVDGGVHAARPRRDSNPRPAE